MLCCFTQISAFWADTFCRLTRHFGSLTFWFSMRHDTCLPGRDMSISARVPTVRHHTDLYDHTKQIKNEIFLNETRLMSSPPPPQYFQKKNPDKRSDIFRSCNLFFWVIPRGEFRPRQTRQLPRAVDLKGRLLSCQSY